MKVQANLNACNTVVIFWSKKEITPELVITEKIKQIRQIKESGAECF